MDKKKDGVDQLNQEELAKFVANEFRLTMLHYGLWFNEVVHQLGLSEALKMEEKVFNTISSIAVKRLSRTMGFEAADGLPTAFMKMAKEKLLSLVDAMAINWLASDGVWFQAVESAENMFTSKRCNDSCWMRFSPLEASTTKSFLKLPEHGGLDALEQALQFRLYARINEQTIEREGNSLIFRMVKCRVQEARKSKGLEDYPCKSGGIVEYSTFARVIDSRIRTECIGCPPDEHPQEWNCAWRFYLEH